MAKATKMASMTGVDAPSPQKPKPSLHVELEDIEGAGQLAVGQRVTLTVTGKVTSMSEEEWGEDKAVHTSLTLRLSKIVKSGKESDDDA